MAGFRKIYTSQNDYLKDLATSTGLFSESEYSRQVNNAQGDDYLAYLSTLKGNISPNFNRAEYDKLADEDKFGYIVHKHSKDTSTEDYKQNEAYYNQKLQEIKNDEIYASLNGFQKTMGTLGGWVGDMALAAYGTLEGLIDVGATLIGGASAVGGVWSEKAKDFAEDMKEFVAQDTTGVTAAKNALANWRDAYTFENTQDWLKIVNEVSSAIGQMAPMIIGAALTPVTGGASLAGSIVYYTAMAGQTAEQAIRTNPDINYAQLYGYTLGTTALEMVTEWASGKLFGEGLIGVAGINKNMMTGSILKNIGHNMFTEGMEEAVSELFGSLLEWCLVTDFDEKSLPTIENILYAAMIGSLTGGFMAGGRVALTTRMGVDSEGNIVRLKDVATENRKNVKKLGLGKSWAVQALLQQSSEALSATDNMTKLQAKYGNLNLQQIQEQHADEYQKAYDSDVEVKEKQAKTFLALSKLMNTIGATKFTQSVELLNNAVEDAKRMADNYINHTATANKKASEVFAANFPNKHFTPTAMPSKQNQTLAETIRQIFPGVKVVFGKFGSKDGSPVRAMDGAETYIFVDETMIDKKGYKTVLRQAIRYQLADKLMEEMNVLDSAEANAIVELFTDSKLSYSELDTKQKLTIAQMLCFDPVNTRKLFSRDMKTHKKIFTYITDNAAYVKKFGRQTEANKMRYHDLLSMRNMYLQNIVDTIGNAEDIAVVENEYGLTPEETKTKLVDKTRTTVVNDVVKLTDLKQSKQAIQQREAFNELNNSRVDTTTPFDFGRMWDKDYYNPEFVASISQTEPDFKKALQDYILRTHNVTFAEKESFVKAYSKTLTANDVELTAKALLTKEYLDSNPSFEDKKTKVIDALYIIKSTGVDEKSLQNVDTIIEENGRVKGTGKLKPFINIQLFSESATENTDSLGRSIPQDVETKFKDSLVKDDGKLIPVYHGADTDFDMFDVTKARYGSNMSFGPGFNFVNDYDYAQNITPETNRVIEAYINITRPASHKTITLDDGALANFIKTHFDTSTHQKVLNTISRAKSDVDIVVGLTSVAKDLKILNNKFMEDIATQLGIDGVITQFDNGQTFYIVYRNQDIYTVSKSSQNPLKTIQEIKQQQQQQQQPNIAEKDISKLASKDYKTGEIRKSKAKGYENVEYEAASVMDYEQYAYDTLKKIKTLDDLKTVLSAIEHGKIGDLEATFILNLLDTVILPTNFKDARRYDTAKKLLDPILSARTTSDAQKMAARSELFGETNPVKSLSTELTEKFGTEVKPSDTVLGKWVEGYSFDRTNWLGRLQNQYNELFDKRKNEKDPYLKQQYTLELHDLRLMIKAVAEGDSATILDLTIKQLQDTDENRAKNAEKVQEIARDLVADLIAHTDVSGKLPKYDSTKKYILKPEHAEKVADFWDKLNTFRYLAMLCSPITGGRNAITNTLVSLNAIVEDGVSGKIEKSALLRQESQANFTGDYDARFSAFVENRYKSRIAMDTKGDKYHTKEIDMIRQEWAAENDPLKKNKLLYKIKEFEQKMLNDQPWTKRRVMRNLKNTLAGSINMISKNAYAEIKTLYKGSTPNEIWTNMVSKNSPLADSFKKTYITNKGSDMVAVLELASQLENTSVLLDQIYNNALYRGNKLLFKTENILSKKIGQLKSNHPAIAALITLNIPFVRTSYNTSAYIANHSPVGLAKGVLQALQTRNMYYGDMRQAITEFHKTEYIKQHKEANRDFRYDHKEFMLWASKHLSTDVFNALNGDYKAIKTVFDKYAELGRVNQNLIGSSDIFARATAIESITQGLTGTAWMTLGLIVGALFKGFKIDEDDYLGPVLQIGDLRIKLDDLSPFSTLFSVGAVINSSESFLDAFEKFAGILIDASMLNVVESAIQHSDSIPDYLGNQSINVVQQFVPAIFKNVTKIIDNAKKNKSGNYFQKLWKTTLSNLPLFSYLVADKIDPYTGDPQKIYQSGLLEALFNQILPIGIRSKTMSDFEREARRIGAETTGFSGRFTVNDVEYIVKNSDKYSKYRADYIEQQSALILSNKITVTVEDENGKRITTTYDKLTDKQKKNVINRLYTEATSMTKLKWWTDQGNTYVVTDRDLYSEYRKMFDNIIYKKNWSKSKFVES